MIILSTNECLYYNTSNSIRKRKKEEKKKKKKNPYYTVDPVILRLQIID